MAAEFDIGNYISALRCSGTAGLLAEHGLSGVARRMTCRRTNLRHLAQYLGQATTAAIYCFQNGTYEAVMAARVQQRCEMMRVLLGAGQWLDQDREVTDLGKYTMTFPT